MFVVLNSERQATYLVLYCDRGRCDQFEQGEVVEHNKGSHRQHTHTLRDCACVNVVFIVRVDDTCIEVV